MYIVPKIEVREAEDIIDFATTMDSDMNLYFEEKKTLLEDILLFSDLISLTFSEVLSQEIP